MACFIVPLTVALGIGAFKNKISQVYHINWLLMLLGGGVLALLLEHIAHQEVVLYPPFLTAINNPANIPGMLYEMATLGSAMTIACVAIWILLIAYVSRAEHTKKKTI